ncbi:DNA-protecting protein DprA [Echinicola strongylocentroti]|uniref:DNA-protecting protein DprA n=1 Tax=Echinicola strongylocentroti TaxID=1795355 RepID=A0A2Z4IDL8_9BACT|nr:DNA-processing protein DprA [Echinicola strongylocentroti]AWW29122.1 DNA-protecting protein DprA [Echinicola strongylocentroti]
MQKTTHETLLYTIALSLIPKLGPYAFKNIVSYCGAAANFFTMPKGRAAKIPGIGSKLLAIRNQKDTYLKQAEKVLEDCEKHQITIHTYLDPSYPSRLKSFMDAPVLLFTKGSIDLNPKRSIGIVGTRNASDYGKNTTRKIVEGLAPFQPTVISGLAYGIDITSHRAALEFELPTIAVLGNSLESLYPAAHRSTAESMSENGGGLISEYAVGTAVHPSNFPARNRIIAALSDALIVVEAAKKGGALITAEIAYSYNREVFAVPGNLQNTYSEGCNNLIRSMKSSIYTGPRDIQEALSWTTSEENASQIAKSNIDLDQYTEQEQHILRILLEKNPLEIDQLSWQSQLPVSQVASLLLNLEFQGVVKALPGKKYQLV